MLSLIVIDDNKIELNNLIKQINELQLNVEIVKTFRYPFDALEYLRNNPVDILISDIQMSQLTGIELLKMLSEENIDIIPILITCYDKFEYAKEAANLNVCSYLSKPIEQSDLKSALEKAIKFQMEKQQRVADKLRLDSFKNSFPHYQEVFLRGILTSDVPNIEYIRINQDIFDLDLLTTYKTIISCKCVDSNKNNMLISNIVSKSFSLSKSQTLYFPIVINDDEISIIAVSVTDKPDIAVDLDIVRKSIVSVLENAEVFFGISATKQDILQIREQLIQSRSALNAIMNSKKHFINIYDAFELSSHTIFDLSTIKKEISELLHILEDKMINLWVKRKIGECADNKHIPQLAYSIVLAVEDILFSFAASFDNFVDSKIIWRKLANFTSIQNIEYWLTNILVTAKMMINMENGDSPELVKDVCRIIKKRYSEDISLEIIANELKYSKRHVHRVFMKYTGKTIQEYLTVYRINVAKKMLSSPDNKIYYVVESVGYKNKTYFSKVFEKHVGISLKDYRELFKISSE